MNITDIITGGLIGSTITLIIKAIIDACCSHVTYKRELRKQVFQRKIDVVERAMSWYQDVVDMYSIYQMAIHEYDGSTNPVIVGKIQYASTQLNKLLQETSTRLNAIYLYYDFADINEKYNVMRSAQVLNEAFVLVGQIQQHLLPTPATNEQELKIQKQWFGQLKQTLDIAASAMDNMKFAIIEIQQFLRNDYQKYTK